MSNDPTRPLPADRMQPGYYQADPYQADPYQPGPYQAGPPGGPPPGRYRRRRRRWPLFSLITLLVLVGLAVGGDRVACAIAENQMASQIQQSGLSVKPNVTIEGFPFLTQVLAHKFDHVVISAANVTGGPLVVASIHADLYGMHISGDYKSATVDSLTGTALITFGAIANAGSIPTDIIHLGPGSAPDQIKATIDLQVTTADVTAQVTKVGPNKFRIRVLDFGGVPADVLGNLADYTYTVPKLPAGMAIQSVDVTSQGVQITITAHHTVLSQ